MSAYSQTATAVIPGANAKRKPVVLAETVTAGMPAYITTAGLGGKADANDAAKSALAGYFEQGGAAGQRVNIITEDDDANLGITLAIGDILIVSSTAGSWAPSSDKTTGDYVAVGGIAKSTSKVNFRPLYVTAAIAA